MVAGFGRRIFAAFLLTLIATAAHAAVAPQNLGFPDVEFTSLQRKNCEVCHGKSLADRHHGTPKAQAGECGFCHTVSTTPGKLGVKLERNCLSCHKTSPHHETQAAKEKKCTSCHNAPGLAAYTTKLPDYGVSKVTPKRSNCRNCHAGGTANGMTIATPQKTHHQAAGIGCDACHGGDTSKTVVRPCEHCHSVEAIHQVEPHLQKTACGGCHNGSGWTAK